MSKESPLVVVTLSDTGAGAATAEAVAAGISIYLETDRRQSKVIMDTQNTHILMVEVLGNVYVVKVDDKRY